MVSSSNIFSGGDPFGVSPLSLLLIQAFVVILVARLLSFALRYLRQPVVVAEVIGGLILGGSALCRIPAFKTHLFPDASLPGFSLVANFGLVFYLFLIGLELDPSKLLNSVKSSIPISLAGISLPFALGVAVARLIYDQYGNKNVAFSSFVIFSGVAMSITAFPVLARILTERRLLQTKVGQATIAAAAIDDVMAWTLLVLVIAIINNASSATADVKSYLTAVYVFLVVVAYVVLLWFTIRPLYRHLLQKAQTSESMENFLLFITFMLVLLSSWFTEVIGVHAIFGSFVVGAVIPHDYGFARKLVAQIEDLIMIVFLPLYFAYSGINTRLDQLNTAKQWGMVLLVIATACAGKLIGCTAAAKLSGLTWRESTAVGVLMNTKGLVELIVLNLGLQAGVITPEIFSIFVVMAVVTTLMTIPLLSIVYPPHCYQDELHVVADSSEGEGSTASMTKPETGLEPLLPNETRVLMLLPTMKAANSMVALASHFSVHTPSLSVYGLRIMHLDHRMSTIMQAAEHGHTIKSDPILSVFRAFFSLQNVRSHPLLTFRDDVVPTVIEATNHVSANLVVLSAHSHADVRDIAVGTPASTVVQFVDKGYTTGHAHARNEDANQLTTSSSNGIILARSLAAAAAANGEKAPQTPVAKTPVSPTFGNTRVLVLVLGGTPADARDDEAAADLAALLIGPASVAGGAPTMLSVISLAPAGTASTALPAIAANAKVSNVTAAPGDLNVLTFAVNDRVASGKDLVVVGETVVQRLSPVDVAEGTSSAAAAAAGGFRAYLEGAGVASVAVVNGKRKTEFISIA